jgi:cytochrome c-type biogenesis protein
MEVGIGLALLAGLASFLSPCVFPLVPAYVSYLSGRSIEANQAEIKRTSLETFFHGVAFVIGFSIVFIFFGIAVSFAGRLLYNLKDWFARIGGIIVIILGIHMTGLFRIRFLEYDIRPQVEFRRGSGYLSSFLLGIFFSAGWSPCVGPVLGAILTLALKEGSIIEGIKLLMAYSLGLAIPFLLAAPAIGWITTILKKYGKFLHVVEVFMGIILILVGILLFAGAFERLARIGQFINLGL